MPEARFEAMGSLAHVVVAGPGGLLPVARRRVEDLEAKWSRFRARSEVSRLNKRGRGRVSWETLALVERSIRGWEATGGSFDPTVQRAMVALGYDRTMAAVGGRSTTRGAAPTPGCGEIVVDRSARRVALPPGAGFDPGGIGKGFAADLVADELMAAGAEGAMVNLGGDLRAIGVSPDGPGWSIGLVEPSAGGEFGTVSIVEGAVATSTPRKRRWRAGGTAHHHLLDPATGRSRTGAPALVTAVATEAWWAEIATKDLMAKDPGAPPLDGVAALVVDDDGSRRMLGGMETYLDV